VAEARDKAPNDSARAPDASAALRADGPALEVRYGPAGRDTLAEIVGELAPDARPPKSPGIEPTLTVGEAFVERETLAAIHAELISEAHEAASPVPRHSPPHPVEPPRPNRVPRPESRPAPTAAPTEIFQLLTFVVRGTDVSRLASERARRQFVEQTLLERLPVHSIDEVERIDASPWTEQQSVVLRVLCRVSTDDS
jgi:hypothetical protein